MAYLPDKNNWKMFPEQIHTNEYRGKVNYTMSGEACVPWASNRKYYQNSARLHDSPIEDTMFPERSIALAENYCRSPTNDRYLWCFVDLAYSFGECDIISKH